MKMKNPITEGGKEFLRTLLIGVVGTIAVQLIIIFALPTVDFIDAVQNPITWIALSQSAGLMVLKDLVTAIGKGADKTVHETGTNIGSDSMEKGITRF